MLKNKDSFYRAARMVLHARPGAALHGGTHAFWLALSTWALLVAVLWGALLPAAGAAPSRLSHFLPQITADSIFPGADRMGAEQSDLPVAPVYAGEKLLGHVYITSDFVNTRGYSSFPIDTVVALASDGTIVGAKLLEHHEPIVLIGIPQSKIEAFIRGYVGKNYVKNPPAPDAGPPVDIVSGATVTVMVIGDSILRSSMLVAQRLQQPQGQAQGQPQAGSGGPVLMQERRVVNLRKDGISDWKTLLEQGAVANLRLTVADVNKRLSESGHPDAAIKDEKPKDTFVDLYMALVSVPSIGKSLLGDAQYTYLAQRLKPDQQAILVAGNGSYSFKGSAYVRGGIFDRIEVVQGLQSFHFTDLSHERLGDVHAEGAPEFKEVALFTVPRHATLDPVAPWRLQLLVQRPLKDNNKAFVSFNLNYELPSDYTRMIAQAPPAVVQTQAGSANPARATALNAVPAVGPAAATQTIDTGAPTQLWKRMWVAKRVQIAVLVVALAILATVFFFQNTFTLNERRFGIFRTGFLIFSLVWLGWYASAQLSVVNVFTFVHALRGNFHWEYFLMDPMVFILWVATAVSILFWNRGAFCGWLCPFGALQELLNKLARRLHVPQLNVPYGVGSRLAALKYVIFLGLFGVSFYDMALVERLAEIEPFKTAIILKFVREWGFVIFALAWILPGLFIERFYCRYVCPLGAGLAIPARMRMFNWLKRYRECGNPCQLCAVECPVQAIAPDGEIQPNECIQCLNCQVLYHSETRCPHVIQVTKRRARNKPAPVQAVMAAPAAAPGGAS